MAKTNVTPRAIKYVMLFKDKTKRKALNDEASRIPVKGDIQRIRYTHT